MKALIRDDEIILEPWNQWTQDHLDWLTTPRPEGDGYSLVENYIESTEESTHNVLSESEVENESDYIVINGVHYSKEELRSLIE